jgi:hypothetical protein
MDRKVVCAGEIVAVNKKDDRVVSFVARMIDDKYSYNAKLHLKGSTLGDVVFVDERMAYKRLKEFDEEVKENNDDNANDA